MFLLILQYLPNDACRRRLLFVSRSWKSFLVSEPSLWPYLNTRLERDIGDHDALWTGRGSVNAPKPGGGIRALEITLGGRPNNRGKRHGDWINTPTMSERFHRLNCAIHVACIATAVDEQGRCVPVRPSTLRSLTISLEPNTSVSVAFLHELSQATRFAIYKFLERYVLPWMQTLRAVSDALALPRVHIDVRVPHLRISGTFFQQWVNVVVLTIRGDTMEDDGDVYPVDQRGWSGPVDDEGRPIDCEMLPNLIVLSLSGAVIPRSLRLPWIPSLVRIHLNSVEFESYTFFLLIRLCRSTLEYLECKEVTFEEEADHGLEDWHAMVNLRDSTMVDDHLFVDDRSDTSDDQHDQPAPIILPNLRILIIAGEITPPFFSSLEFVDSLSGEAPSYPTPIFVMPSLNLLSMDEIVTEQDAIENQSESPLAILGRSAPNVVDFKLSNCTSLDASVFQCFASMAGAISILDLSSSSVTDRLVCHLPGLLPQLDSIDVRGCTDVTIQAVARIVENIRNDRNGAPGVREVYIDRPQYGSAAEYDAYAWLDWVGVLRRDEFDFEGDGPEVGDPHRRAWIKAGKTDAQREERNRREAKEQKERLLAAEHLANMVASYGMGASGTGVGAGGRILPASLTSIRLPVVPPIRRSLPTPPVTMEEDLMLSIDPNLDASPEDPASTAIDIEPTISVVAVIDPSLTSTDPRTTAIEIDSSSPTIDPRLAALERRSASEDGGGIQ